MSCLRFNLKYPQIHTKVCKVMALFTSSHSWEIMSCFSKQLLLFLLLFWMPMPPPVCLIHPHTHLISSEQVTCCLSSNHHRQSGFMPFLTIISCCILTVFIKSCHFSRPLHERSVVLPSTPIWLKHQVSGGSSLRWSSEKSHAHQPAQISLLYLKTQRNICLRKTTISLEPINFSVFLTDICSHLTFFSHLKTSEMNVRR